MPPYLGVAYVPEDAVCPARVMNVLDKLEHVCCLCSNAKFAITPGSKFKHGHTQTQYLLHIDVCCQHIAFTYCQGLHKPSSRPSHAFTLPLYNTCKYFDVYDHCF